jgi:hypothetical protein
LRTPTFEETSKPKPNNTIQRVFQSFLGQTLTRRRLVIPQSLLLCSACVGISPFVTKSLFFLRGSFDGKGVGVGGDKEVFWGSTRWNHRLQPYPLERKELNGRIRRFGSTNNDDL